jgi:cytosine/adenosine deaminase-related metal-dependent hydrolase
VEQVAILPGLVNAHVHLQIPKLNQKRRAFLPWLRRVMAEVGASTEADKLRSAASSIEQLLASGCTSVGEIDSNGLSARLLRSTPIGGRCYQEVTGFDLSPRRSKDLLAMRDLPGSSRCLRGLSPHAPYSVSPALFRACAAMVRKATVHLAESKEEVEFLATGKGPFRDLLVELGRLPKGFKAVGTSPLEFLASVGLLGPDCSLVHCQELGPGDPERIAAAGAKIVLCPGSIEYFRRKPVPLLRWLKLGIRVALGTDSRASNVGLSMLAEMATARRLWPQLSPDQVLAMATRNGALALNRPGLGKLAEAGTADFIRVHIQPGSDWSACSEELTHGRSRVLDTFCAGARVTGKSGYNAPSTVGSGS